MANEIRVRGNFLSGALSTGVSAADTGLTSAQFNGVPVIDATQHMPLVLDPGGVAGPPEVVWITAKATLAGTNPAVLRGQEGTTARIHAAGTRWIQSPLASDAETSVAWRLRSGSEARAKFPAGAYSAVPPSAYPDGLTTYQANNDDGSTWPGNGYVTVSTWSQGNYVANSRTHQQSVDTLGSTYERTAQSDNTWTSWRLRMRDDEDFNSAAQFSDPPSAFPGRVSARYVDNGTGSPTGTGSWTLLTVRRSDTVCFQQAIWRSSNPGATTPDIYYRHGHEGGTGGPWSAWKPLAVDSGWAYLTPTNGWANYTVSFPDLRYRKINGMVTVQGMVVGTSQTSTTIATLPVGFRPGYHLYGHARQSDATVCNYDILSSGIIRINSTASWISLMSVTFPADQ